MFDKNITFFDFVNKLIDEHGNYFVLLAAIASLTVIGIKPSIIGKPRILILPVGILFVIFYSINNGNEGDALTVIIMWVFFDMVALSTINDTTIHNLENYDFGGILVFYELFASLATWSILIARGKLYYIKYKDKFFN